jgi:hypothetical protein
MWLTGFFGWNRLDVYGAGCCDHIPISQTVRKSGRGWGQLTKRKKSYAKRIGPPLDEGGPGEGIRFREIAEAIGSRLGLPAVSIPADVLMLPGYFGFLANLVTLDLPAFNLITRQTLGWERAQPSLLADLDNGHYFPKG